MAFAVALAALPASAQERGVLARFSANPGAVVSYTFGEQGGFGVGIDASVRAEVREDDEDSFIGAGPHLQYEWTFHRSAIRRRRALGLEAASIPATGVEAGGLVFQIGRASELTGETWADALHTGGAGTVSIASIGLRGTLPGGGGWGQLAVVLALRLPVRTPFGGEGR